MARKLPLKIAIIAGEESGDLLGADLIDALRGQTDRLINLVGVGGSHLQQRGLKSLFDPGEIALMGLSSVLKNMPRLVWRIAQTARAVVAAKPDCLIIIDSPDFTHRVAKKVRAANPTIPIVKYIAPTVWAWRPQRAKSMRAYVDHVLTILPFEVDVLKRLSGPPATYAGHRLASYKPILDVRAARISREAARADGEERTLLVLPGSRRSEIKTLMEPFGKAVAELAGRVETLHVMLPTLPEIEPMVRTLSADWPVKPLIVTSEEDKWKAFAQADAALAASGTVSLELALAHVPTVLAYKVDWFAKQFLMPRITTWSAALPNIIADEAIIPEHFNEFVRPGLLARQLDRLMQPGPARDAQISGFQDIVDLMMTDRPAGEIAAKAVLDLLENGKSPGKSR
ncbi:lipid-A-disaccharide synthase [Phyllobacterium phragmitis]|uniref:Lipid-A-disaccharide synthase n=1 Tax=Phyllobacterium phragmitis TaxID=2670329 RepID=A0A2S9INZ1_9HYPH|nr:lipid-A-disaccharide synthase [Phyllobacterium phragmitis]PRD42247.1 lipid-A-disaccharide synthase [Phyllobacterium phragmitis]